MRMGRENEERLSTFLFLFFFSELIWLSFFVESNMNNTLVSIWSWKFPHSTYILRIHVHDDCATFCCRSVFILARFFCAFPFCCSLFLVLFFVWVLPCLLSLFVDFRCLFLFVVCFSLCVLPMLNRDMKAVWLFVTCSSNSTFESLYLGLVRHSFDRLHTIPVCPFTIHYVQKPNPHYTYKNNEYKTERNENNRILDCFLFFIIVFCLLIFIFSLRVIKWPPQK